MIRIFCENTGQSKSYKFGTNLKEIAEDLSIKMEYRILGALIDNKIHELSYRLSKDSILNFIDITHKEGMRMYFRSLYFVLLKAIKDIIPDANPMIEHSISNGYYCEIVGLDLSENEELVLEIKAHMQNIIEQDLPFVRNDILNSEAIEIFEKNNFVEKANLFKQSPSLYTVVYTFDDLVDYFYGCLVPSSGYLFNFDLVQLYEGLLLRIPKAHNPKELEHFVKQDKLFDILDEHKNWVEILNTANVGRLNEKILQKTDGEIIKVTEALHEKKIAEIAEKFKARGKAKLILVSGPSSSGKTTFSKRLSVQLKVIGLQPFMISLDNYFVDRELTPKDENGEYDFESIEAIDIDEFTININDLFEGKEVQLPKFSFDSGRRFYDDGWVKAEENTIIIVEGIHALNPKLTHDIKNELKYKIYVSALTQIGIDGHNRIPTTDNRLLRRIIRDYKYRNYSAYETLKRWDSVRRGEEKNIFPYQEQADIMFNSALVYELAVIKKHVEPLLKSIHQREPEYAEAERLLKFLSYFKNIEKEEEIPPTSILREFLGKSTFHY
jgi:uridine kinase